MPDNFLTNTPRTGVCSLLQLNLVSTQVIQIDELLELPVVILGPVRYQIFFWNALILAAAEAGGAEILYTEDLNDGQQYGSVLVRNPFRQARNTP